MKKAAKKFMVLALIAAMVLAMTVPVSAANKNVTKKYKKQVSSILDDFDLYLGYACSGTFKFDTYTRTSMLLHSGDVKAEKFGTLASVKKSLKPYMQLYFGRSSVNVQKYSKKLVQSDNASTLWLVKNGRVQYMGGDWGTWYPVGTVTKIIQTGSKTFQVTYNIRLYNMEKHSYIKKMGTFKFYLKKSSNKNGFVITNIKRTASY